MSYAFAPSCSIIFIFGIFLADFIIFDLEFLSEIIREFLSLYFSKNALNNFEPEVEEKVKESTISDESPEDKLNKLTALKDKDLITEEDYNTKKEEILKNM